MLPDGLKGYFRALPVPAKYDGLRPIFSLTKYRPESTIIIERNNRFLRLTEAVGITTGEQKISLFADRLGSSF